SEVFEIQGDLETITDDAVVQAWSAGGLSGETASFTANNVSASVLPATITRGAGLEASSLSSGFSSRINKNLTNSDITDFDTAEDKASYLEFNIDVKANQKVSLSGIDAKLRRSGAGANRYVWA